MKKKNKIEENVNENVENANVNENVNEVEELKKKVEDLEAKVAELEDLKLRQMAEFDNFRRRTQKEKLELMDNAGERIFVDMLPLIDDFERAIASLSTSSSPEGKEGYLTGVQLIYQKFLKFLEQNKVTPIETENKEFSTDEHEAITTFAAGEDKKGKIIDCTQKGYKLGEKVIRFAKVVVGE